MKMDLTAWACPNVCGGPDFIPAHFEEGGGGAEPLGVESGADQKNGREFNPALRISHVFLTD